MVNNPSARCVGGDAEVKERGNDARDLLDFVEFRERRWCVLITVLRQQRLDMRGLDKILIACQCAVSTFNIDTG